MSTEENKATVRKFIEEVMNGGNVAAIPDFMVPGSMLAGAFQGFITNNKMACPDFHLTIDEMVGENDKVFVQTTLRATQMGELLGHPPTGKTVTTTGVYIFKIVNGKIISGQWVFDRLDMAQQWGWIPTPSQA